MNYTIELTKWEKMMVDYGFFHQKMINLSTHFIGVPIIVASVFIPLSWWSLFSFEVGGMVIPITLAPVIATAVAAYYFSLDKKLGGLSVPFIIGLLFVSHQVSVMGISISGTWAAIGFFGGFALQFIGHGLEGKNPALIAYNPIVAMITSPLFVIAEFGARIGIQKELFQKVWGEIDRLEARSNSNIDLDS